MSIGPRIFRNENLGERTDNGSNNKSPGFPICYFVRDADEC